MDSEKSETPVKEAPKPIKEVPKPKFKPFIPGSSSEDTFVARKFAVHSVSPPGPSSLAMERIQEANKNQTITKPEKKV